MNTMGAAAKLPSTPWPAVGSVWRSLEKPAMESAMDMQRTWRLREGGRLRAHGRGMLGVGGAYRRGGAPSTLLNIISARGGGADCALYRHERA
jgi:hypothetical protein